MKHLLISFFLLIGLCQNTYAQKLVKPFPNLINRETMPEPDQKLYEECIKWYTLQHENLPSVAWDEALKRRPNGVIVGIQPPYLFFLNNIKKDIVSLAQSSDNGAPGNIWPESGLVHWCATMKRVLDENPDIKDEQMLCRWDLNYFCHSYLQPLQAEEYSAY